MAYKLEFHAGWRSHILQRMDFPMSSLDIYEFGVFSGNSVLEFIRGVTPFGYRKIFGFDSFMGLPKDIVETAWQADWVEGGYDARKVTQTEDPQEASRLIAEAINDPCYVPIVGFYEDVLKDTLIAERGLDKALIIDIDVDLYSSTVTVLDFMFGNKLYVPQTTLIFYDDWGGSIGWETYSSGESKAHKEMTEKYGIQTKEIFSTGRAFPHVQKIFQIM